ARDTSAMPPAPESPSPSSRPPRRREPDALAETIAYVADAGSDLGLGEDDGFPAVDDLLNSTLGQYRLEEAVGRGSMGRVYRAQHLGLGRACALKVMNPGLLAKEPRLRERFWAEARAVAQLVHPH